MKSPVSAEAISRERSPGLDVTTVAHGGIVEAHLTVRPVRAGESSALFVRLADALAELGAQPVRQEIFGALTAWPESKKLLEKALGEITWPVSWLESGSKKAPVTGMHVTALAGAVAEPVRLGGRIVGSLFRDAHAAHCVLGDIRPARLEGTRPDQAREAFENLEAALAQAGLALSDVVRTWLFLDDILGWYDPFNTVRTRFFRERNLFDGLIPASTGVGARNLAGAAALVGAWAARPHGKELRVFEVDSPLQCSARSYGSCFSRAVEMVSPDCRRLLVSGTASIARDGHTNCLGNVAAQIRRTMDVVRGILQARQMNFYDSTRATAYFKDLRDAPHFAAWCSKHGMEFLPVAVAQADICRDDLLFELEMDAIQPNPRAKPENGGRACRRSLTTENCPRCLKKQNFSLALNRHSR